ncbi:unnamed protein product, partial [Discosporangium mesarthrocarpum]
KIVRRQVLSSVLERVTTSRAADAWSHVRLLGLLARRGPDLLLGERSSQGGFAGPVRDVFGSVAVLPAPVAEGFLSAISPLLGLRPRLVDALVLPLRKALFSRDERARLVAVGGLVLLLRA